LTDVLIKPFWGIRVLLALNRVVAGLLSLLVLLLASMVNAEQVKQMHTQAALVPNQSAEEREVAASSALAQVLVRMSGSVDALDAPAIERLLQRPEAYLESFHYEATEELIDYRGQPVQAARLVLKFSGSALEKALRDAQQPVWPANRPSSLVWLVAQQPGGVQVINPAEDELLDKALTGAAANVGLPIALPLLDLQDQMAASAADLWSLDQEAIRSASRRYAVDAVLVGRYSETSSGQWMASWLFEHKAKQQLFDSEGVSREEMIEKGLQRVAAYLAGLYGVVASDMPANALVAKIDGIDGFGDYVQALEYLNKLAIVGHVGLLSLEGDVMTVSLFVEGNDAVLMDTLALDRKLNYVEDLAIQGTVPQYRIGSINHPLKFEWLGGQ